MKEPAFISVIEGTLFVSTFAPFGAGTVQQVPNISNVIKSNSWSSVVPNVVLNNFLWPNNMIAAPSSLPDVLFSLGDGFLPPGKDNGAMYLVYRNLTAVSISTVKKGFFYHMGFFVDVNADGLVDVLTARGKKSLFGGSAGELVWFQNPGRSSSSSWVEHVVGSGPDIGIDVVQDTGNGDVYVAAAEFFAQRLTLWHLVNGTLAQGSPVVVDNSDGAMYGVRHVDAGQGKKTLFSNNYKYSGQGTIYAYTSFPTYSSRMQVATGFHNRQYAPGSGAPGWLYPHHPLRNATSTDPISLFVCGDGAETFTLLSPIGPNTWNATFVDDYHSTAGAAAVGDFDNDGYTDVFVTDYNAGKVHYYTYAPKK